MKEDASAWVSVSAEEYEVLKNSIYMQSREKLAPLFNRIESGLNSFGEENSDVVRLAARQKYCNSSNDIEVDSNAAFSREDEGVWVQGWLWLDTGSEDSQDG